MESTNKKPFKENWSQIKTDLKQATAQWDALSESLEGQNSKEETRLKEMKDLLKKIQDQLSGF